MMKCCEPPTASTTPSTKPCGAYKNLLRTACPPSMASRPSSVVPANSTTTRSPASPRRCPMWPDPPPSHGRPGVPSPNAGTPDPVSFPASYYGCGDYVEWLKYESAAWRKEQRAEKIARFADCVDLPPDLYAIKDGLVVLARTGEPLAPLHEQIARLQAEQERKQAVARRRADREILKPIVDLYSILG